MLTFSGRLQTISISSILFCSSALGYPYTTPNALNLSNQREQSFSELRRGHVISSADQLLQSLRSVPPEDREAVDAAYGSAHLLMFVLFWIMDDAQRRQFYEENFDVQNNDMDAFLYNYHRLMSGLPSSELSKIRGTLAQLARDTRNPAVRVYCYFVICDLYFRYDEHSRNEARLCLARDFADLEIARTGLRYPLLEQKDKGLEGILLALDYFPLNPVERAFRKSDPVYRAVKEAFPMSPMVTPRESEIASGLARLIQIAETHVEWPIRYDLLQVVAAFKNSGYMEPFVGLCRSIGGRTVLTPDVLRARKWLYKDARGRRNVAEMQSWIDSMYAGQTRVCEAFERDLYEDTFRSFEDHAETLEGWDLPKEAAAAYERLAAHFPSSVISAKCAARAAQLRPLGTE